MRILGIDPGTRITGFACVDAGADPLARPALVEAGVFRLGADESDIPARLAELDADLRALLDRLRPELVAVESLFAHYKHPATAITMAHARGVVLLAARHAAVTLIELKPNAVKKAITGHGHASKHQIQHAVMAAYDLAELPSPEDMADAIAIATCAAWRSDAMAT
jgi:crossover junction endodeoxyribonuclease RuvC